MSVRKEMLERINIRADLKKLLDNRDVVQEISRHQWIESEKAGHDIGFNKACEDWMSRFATAWVEYHLRGTKQKRKRASSSKKA